MGKQVGSAGKYCQNIKFHMRDHAHDNVLCPKGTALTGTTMNNWNAKQMPYVLPITRHGQNGVN
eukprot:gene34469-44696_t